MPMRWALHDHRDIPISMAIRLIHGCDGIAMAMHEPPG